MSDSSRTTLCAPAAGGASHTTTSAERSDAATDTSPKRHAAGAETNPAPCSVTRVPPSTGPPCGKTRAIDAAAASKRAKRISLLSEYATPSGAAASRTAATEGTAGERTLMALPSSVQSSGWTPPCLPKRTRASPSSKRPCPRIVSSVPPAIGAPCGATLEMTTSAPGWPKMANEWFSAVLSSASPLRLSSIGCGVAGQTSTAGAAQRTSLGPSTVAAVSSSADAAHAARPPHAAARWRSASCECGATARVSGGGASCGPHPQPSRATAAAADGGGAPASGSIEPLAVRGVPKAQRGAPRSTKPAPCSVTTSPPAACAPVGKTSEMRSAAAS